MGNCLRITDSGNGDKIQVHLKGGGGAMFAIAETTYDRYLPETTLNNYKLHYLYQGYNEAKRTI